MHFRDFRWMFYISLWPNALPPHVSSHSCARACIALRSDWREPYGLFKWLPAVRCSLHPIGQACPGSVSARCLLSGIKSERVAVRLIVSHYLVIVLSEESLPKAHLPHHRAPINLWPPFRVYRPGCSSHPTLGPLTRRCGPEKKLFWRAVIASKWRETKTAFEWVEISFRMGCETPVEPVSTPTLRRPRLKVWDNEGCFFWRTAPNYMLQIEGGECWLGDAFPFSEPPKRPPSGSGCVMSLR